MTRKDTPIVAKLFALITIVYALSSIDLIPDFIPFLGYLDDLIILPLLISILIKLIPPYILEECIAESLGMWEKGKPKKWYYAVPIIVIWVIRIIIIAFNLIKEVPTSMPERHKWRVGLPCISGSSSSC